MEQGPEVGVIMIQTLYSQENLQELGVTQGWKDRQGKEDFWNGSTETIQCQVDMWNP